MVWLTIDIVPPPTSFFILTRPRSGSMPVVSQSIIRPIVPVGASTDAWLLRTPNSLPSANRRLPRLLARLRPARCGTAWVLLDVVARVTVHRRAPAACARGLSAKPSNGPIRAAVRALVAYEWPVMSEVSDAAHARPSGES